MDPQLVDWGGSAVLLGIFWQATAWSMERMIRRLDRQDEHLAELRADMKAGQVRIDGNLLRIVGQSRRGQGRIQANRSQGEGRGKRFVDSGQWPVQPFKH